MRASVMYYWLLNCAWSLRWLKRTYCFIVNLLFDFILFELQIFTLIVRGDKSVIIILKQILKKYLIDNIKYFLLLLYSYIPILSHVVGNNQSLN